MFKRCPYTIPLPPCLYINISSTTSVFIYLHHFVFDYGCHNENNSKLDAKRNYSSVLAFQNFKFSQILCVSPQTISFNTLLNNYVIKENQVKGMSTFALSAILWVSLHIES